MNSRHPHVLAPNFVLTRGLKTQTPPHKSKNKQDCDSNIKNKKCINASGIGEPFIYQLNSITSTKDHEYINTTTIIPAIVLVPISPTMTHKWR